VVVVKNKVFCDMVPWNMVKVTTVLEVFAVIIFRIVRK
jgi:hypothetical protein